MVRLLKISKTNNKILKSGVRLILLLHAHTFLFLVKVKDRHFISSADDKERTDR